MRAMWHVAEREATNSIIKTGMDTYPKQPGYKSIDLSFEQDTLAVGNFSGIHY